MDIPRKPPVGCLIAYEYVWAREHRDDGEKVRPCIVIGAFEPDAPGKDRREIALVLPVSHSPPREGQRALEFPREIKRVFKMDLDPPSWIYLDDLNTFRWSGADVRPASHVSRLPSAKTSCVVDALPDKWFKDLQRQFISVTRERQSQIKNRTEPPPRA